MSDSSGISRRNFFGAGVTAGTIAALGTAVPLLGSNTAAAAVSSTFSAAFLALEFDGTHAGLLTGADGGGLMSPRITTAPLGSQPRGLPGSNAGPPEPQSINLTFGGNLSVKALDWLMAKDASPHNVDVVMYQTATGNEIYRLSMSRVIVANFGLAKLDATRNESLEFSATLFPAQASHVFMSGTKFAAAAGKQKLARANLFRFFVQGLEQSTQQTRSVEHLSFTRNLRLGPSMDGRSAFDVVLTPGGGIDTIEAVLPLGAAGPFYQWMSDQVAGKPADRAGQVQLLAADGKTVATIDLIGLRPLGVSTPFDAASGGDSFPLVKVSLIAGDIKFNLKDLAS
jgi:hypothetical protein